MLRTWAVRLPAIEFTESVSVRHAPDTSSTTAWPPSMPSDADLARDARDLGREHVHLLDHAVHDPRGAQELAFERPALDLERHGLRQVAFRDGRDALR